MPLAFTQEDFLIIRVSVKMTQIQINYNISVFLSFTPEVNKNQSKYVDTNKDDWAQTRKSERGDFGEHTTSYFWEVHHEWFTPCKTNSGDLLQVSLSRLHFNLFTRADAQFRKRNGFATVECFRVTIAKYLQYKQTVCIYLDMNFKKILLCSETVLLRT